MLKCRLGETIKPSLKSPSCSAQDMEPCAAYQIHDLAASRRRRPADPDGKPARGAPSPGRLRATCRGLRSSWRCVSSAESHVWGPYTHRMKQQACCLVLSVFTLVFTRFRLYSSLIICQLKPPELHFIRFSFVCLLVLFGEKGRSD